MFRNILSLMKSNYMPIARLTFIRSIFVLAGGTAAAQLLAILALPFITRLYSPAEFSLFAVYVSVSSLISIVACLRLEIAIPMPVSDEDAANLLAIAISSCTCVAILTGIGVAFFPRQLICLIGQPELLPYLYLLPLGIWVTSLFTAIQYWSTRKKEFNIIAKTRISQTIGGVASQLSLGLIGVGALGLFLGHLVRNGTGLTSLLRHALHEDKMVFKGISWIGMRRIFKRYIRIPQYSLIEAFFNTAGAQIPIIIIAATGTGQEAGYLNLALSALSVPLTVIGSSVAQVYLSQAPIELRAGRLGVFTTSVIGGLIKSGAGPLILAGILAPVIFPLVFGAEWKRAGELAQWMTPWFVMQFIASPVSMTLQVTGNQRIALVLQLFGGTFRIAAVALAAFIANSWTVEVYAISGFIFYSIYLVIVMRLAQIKINDVQRVMLESGNYVVFWIVGAAILEVALRISY
jgi:O-antigen/teichoic acid export membrane protein